MYTNNRILAAKSSVPVYLLPKMANRHGLIAGATGTGKTVTLKVLAESFSDMGVPVFLADVKGDLAGLAVEGTPNPKLDERIKKLGIEGFSFKSYPVRFWDLFGENGHPVRTTISDMGSLLLGRMLGLNETQAGVLNIVFRVADDNGLLLLDLKDLRAMIQYVGDHAKELTTDYGNVSSQTIGTILRGLLTLEDQGGAHFFGEPALDIFDWMQATSAGKGYVNILHSTKLYLTPVLYSTFLLWMLSELFEVLPEAGDLDMPKMVFFFDEAHLLFEDAPKALLDKIEQVVRLIRSKGVGVYFVTQTPADIPQDVLGQLGNRVQHALRAFTPADRKFVKAAAQSFRANPAFSTETAITELATGEALISFLEADGKPAVVERAFVLPPQSSFSAIDDATRSRIIASSNLAGKYDRVVDRESACEILTKKVKQEQDAVQQEQERILKQREFEKNDRMNARRPHGTTAPRPGKSMLEKAAGSAVTTIGREVGRQLIRGILGSLSKR
ncbi:MAG: DUF853 domain-containing protein [Spirochaetia bacterium]|nr:DUF853 domain-containing protein [Spirochaetia bacterium]